MKNEISNPYERLNSEHEKQVHRNSSASRVTDAGGFVNFHLNADLGYFQCKRPWESLSPAPPRPLIRPPRKHTSIFDRQRSDITPERHRALFKHSSHQLHTVPDPLSDRYHRASLLLLLHFPSVVGTNYRNACS
jgi:hypothetical protein